MTCDNSWVAKAKALDRYRWYLLRERHGMIGSAVRFARDAFADWYFGLCAQFRLAASFVVKPCDFLLLQSAPKVIAFQRKKLLLEALRQKQHTLVETALQKPNAILRQRLLKQPPYPVPIRYFGYAAHAEWLVARHAPQILLNDRNGSLYTPFLRLALASPRQGLLVHLAHATTVERSQRLGMNDYDYYFLFGPSSLDALQARTLRFGSSTVLLAGSHMIDKSFDLPPPDLQLRTMLILGVGPDKEKEPGYQRTYSLLREWARETPRYKVLVKRHPRSHVPFWQEAAQTIKSITVLPTDCSLAHALEQASIVVNIMSNAVIEAGLAARPVIYCNLSDDCDIFHQEDFFGPAIDSLVEFHARIREIENNFPECIEKAKVFSLYHLAHGSHGLEKTLQALENLLKSADLPHDIDKYRLEKTC